MKPEPEARGPADLEVPPRLRGIERTALEEHVGRLGYLCGLRQHLGNGEVEVGVGVRELRRHSVGAQPGRDAACVADRAERRELRLAIEPVAGLGFERGRALTKHPRAVLRDRRTKAVLTRGPRRADGREDAAPAACSSS